jgi:excisionase family DNA binding protein
MNLLSTQQAAKRLGVSDARIRRLILDGRLPSQKVGRDHLIREEDLALVTDRPTGRPKKAETAEKASGVPMEYPLEAAEHMKETKPKTKAKPAKKRATKKGN